MHGSSHAQQEVLPAWRALRPDSELPGQIEIIKHDGQGTAVYRLPGVGVDGKAIVAKRSPRITALVERAVYEEFLPRIPLPGPRYHGSVDEPDDRYAWLFVDDVGGRKYRSHDPRHRTAAAQWLATMNAYAAGILAADRLPSRGTRHYLDLLRSSRDGIRSTLCDADLDTEDRDMLMRVIGHCHELESRWVELDQACASMPATLVHGDFIDNNVYLRDERSSFLVFAVDWEKAGWGIPAEDISSVDISSYWRTLRHHGLDLCLQEVEQAARAGRVFRCLVFLYWAVQRFTTDPIDSRIEDVRRCESWISDFVRREIWLGT